MIIKRQGKDYYYISSRGDLDGKMLEPKIPVPQDWIFAEVTDRKIKRIPIYTSVREGLAAKGARQGEVLTVYRVTGIYPSEIITPTIIQSPLSKVLGEKWAISGIQLRKIGDVEVGKEIEKVSVPVARRKYDVTFHKYKDLRPEWEQKKTRLYSLKSNTEVVPFSKEIISEFKGPGNMLRHARWNAEMDGYAIMDGWGKDLMGYVIWSTIDKEIKGLEVIKKYQRQGLGKELLSLAEESGIKSLTVNKNNHKAISLYTNYGYVPVKESGVMIWMKKQ